MKKILLIIGFVLLLACQSWATTYNIGPGQTYETFTALEAAVVLAGDDIVDGGGNTFTETWTPATSGTAGHVITIRNALVSGADIINGWSKTVGQTNVYEASFTINANIEEMLWENDVQLTEQASISNVDSNAGSFWFDSGKVYIHTSWSDDPSTNGSVYEGAARTVCVYVTTDYVTISNVDVTKAYGDDTTKGGVEFTGDYLIYENSEAYEHRRHGVTLYSSSNSIVRNTNIHDIYASYGISAYFSNCDGNIIEYNTVHDSMGIITVHGDTSTNTNKPTNTTIRFNTLYNADITDAAFTSGKSVLEIYTAENTAIYGNYIYGVFTNKVFNIYNSWTSNIDIYGNVIILENLANHKDAILINATVGVEIINNTFVGGNNRTVVRNYGGASGTIIKNNIFSGVYEAYNIEADSQADVAINYNNVYATTFQYGQWGATDCADLSAWQTASSQSANSITTDPDVLSTYKISSNSPNINTGVFDTIHYQAYPDKWKKYVYRVPNIGVDQGAGAPKGGSQILRIGGGIGF